jgi:hypothetical protein
LTLNDSSTSFRPSTRVLVRPIGLDMVEVGGSNPPGPTKIKNPPLGGFFGFGGVGLDEGRCLTIATHRAFVRRSKAKAPGGFNRQRLWRLKTIRLVLSTSNLSINSSFLELKSRYGI